MADRRRNALGWVMLATVVGGAAALAAPPALAQRVSLIRDAEIESTIRAYADPVSAAAGLDASAVRIHLVGDDRLNAFVAGGQQLFINTGLLIRAETPGQVVGVVAHEFGHIAGGHLARLHDQLRNASVQAIISTLLGAAVAVANPGAGIAVIGAGQQAARQSALLYSRTQEQAADAAALAFLDRAGLSAKGMLDFLDILRRQEFLTQAQPNPYLQTHPLTGERIAAVANHVAVSRFSDRADSPDLVKRHARMRAKLIGFTRSQVDVLRDYPEADDRIEARYARAIAVFRRGELKAAMPLVDGLVAAEPKNPYFHELRGQVLFENGRVAEALPSYRDAVALAPDEPLLQIGLAQVEIETGDPSLLAGTATRLNGALRAEPDLLLAWRLLAIAEGRRGAKGEAALAQAELALREGDKGAARQHAGRAAAALPSGSPAWLRAQDIRAALD